MFDVLEANELRLSKDKRTTPERVVKMKTSEGINGVLTSQPTGVRSFVLKRPNPRQP